MRVLESCGDLLAVLLPARCVHCGAAALDESWRPLLCGECAGAVRRPERAPASVSGATVQAAWVFAGPIRSALHSVKYDGNIAAGRWLGKRMAASIRLGPELPIVPVPLHWRRRWRRGHNQAAALAAGMAAAGVGRVASPLRRVRATSPQVGLDVVGRERNLRGAFRVPKSMAATVRDRRLLLVDDVLTTGATVRSARAALLVAGAREVRIAVAAIALRNVP